jgi:hypothetical protein
MGGRLTAVNCFENGFFHIGINGYNQLNRKTTDGPSYFAKLATSVAKSALSGLGANTFHPWD